jgi:hypothetical protein
MDAYFVVPLVVGVVSLVVSACSAVLAVVAIWHSIQSERRSLENYNRAERVLAEITAKAASIEKTVGITEAKLLDTVIFIARSRQETTHEMLTNEVVPAILQYPKLTHHAELLKRGPQAQSRN